jgi:hypothetical protein
MTLIGASEGQKGSRSFYPHPPPIGPASAIGVVVTGHTSSDTTVHGTSAEALMRAYVTEGGFGIDKLTVVERDVREPRHDEVLVRVRACSLNRRDLMTVEGQYNPRQPCRSCRSRTASASSRRWAPRCAT